MEKESDIEVIRCVVCFEDFNTTDHIPYVLTCGHTVCKSYIENCYSQELKSIKCPLDNQIHNYENVNDIPKNFMLINSIEKAEKEKLKKL